MRTIRIQNNQWSLEHCPVLCIVHFAAPFPQKCDHLPPPPPDPYISETAFSHRFQKVYTYPANGTKFWHIGPKVHKTQEKCQNPPRWRTTNVPERYLVLAKLGLPSWVYPVEVLHPSLGPKGEQHILASSKQASKQQQAVKKSLQRHRGSKPASK